MEPSTHKFPKSARVVNQTDFDRVFKSGLHVADATLVLHVCKNDRQETRLGLSVSKRVGNAVVRNGWKRHLREAFRTQRCLLPTGLDIVARPRKDSVLDHNAIAASIRRLALQAAKRLG
jgi:ribonuclease P protein component